MGETNLTQIYKYTHMRTQVFPTIAMLIAYASCNFGYFVSSQQTTQDSADNTNYDISSLCQLLSNNDSVKFVPINDKIQSLNKFFSQNQEKVKQIGEDLTAIEATQGYFDGT